VGIIKKIFSHTRKPEGFLGKMMLNRMNAGHAKIIDGMKCYAIEEIEAALRNAGFSEVESEHHHAKPWITVLAKK